MKKTTLVLYFPYPSVGGVSVLFLRMAKLLVNSYRVILMDYKDGYMANKIPDGVEFIEYNKKELVPKDAIIVFQGVYLWRIRSFSRFPETCRVLFWHLHPDIYFPFYKYKFINHKYLKYITLIMSFMKYRLGRSLVRKLLSKKALVFMDKPNEESTFNYFKLNLFSSEYLKIFTENNTKITICDTKYVNKKHLNFGWIGRLEDFKSTILLHTLERLKSVTAVEFNFTIIGKGHDSQKFQDFKDNCSEFDIVIINEIKPDDIPLYLSRFDILFAMGTSALEGAKLGVPTFLLDYSYREFVGLYKYELLYEKSGFSVGELISDKNIEEKCSLGSRILDILENFEKVSADCKKYWEENFSPSTFIVDLEKSTESTSMTVGDLLRSGFHKPDIITKLLFKIRKPPVIVENSAWQY